ncbi:hypothetical protein VHUM_02848 [Vanrija humicola]|uniref:Zn(2)-C6 fungal-type domain-containing protein n=1 Tax=Vanrija humicola TaxID=5417 RepID=A0A7D8YYU0_VANHU|nr:hypothetical protein VHUM_02848 [Vanrija humicola]
MERSPEYEGILDDETLAPLKRNHACLQCKKRKVKCDAVRPTCNPCLRSHAHALRSAQRNKSRPPPLVCSYAEGDEEELAAAEAEAQRKRAANGTAGPSLAKRTAIGVDRFGREKNIRTEEEKDTLRARIAELEARIAALTTDPAPSVPLAAQASLYSGIGNKPGVTLDKNAFNPIAIGTSPIINGPEVGRNGQVPPPVLHIETGEPGNYQTFDFSNLLVLPANWPKNLPSPAILEHLIDTFFQCEPQLPRIIHRASLMARLKLPPTSDDFPFPGLLHAICASAAPHTPWTTSLQPEELEATRMRHIALGLDLESCEDFAMAQAEAAERCIRHSTVMCVMGPGSFIFDVLRAHLVLSTVYFTKNMPLRSWITAGTPGRLIKALELINRNPRKSDKGTLMPDCASDRDREERYATVWMAYLMESTLSVNSAWSQSLEVDEIGIPLPTSNEEFNQKNDFFGMMKPNPQTAHEPDVLVNHPVIDPFVLVIKCSLLLGRAAKWIRQWQQRVMQPGDEMEGLKSSTFIQLNGDIFAFQLSLPSHLKNIYRSIDAGNAASAFTADIMSLHVFPNTAILLLHEQFVDWTGRETAAHSQIQKAFEAIVGYIHLVPSQLDISHLLTPLLTFSLFTVGRFINKFIARANKLQQYAQASRWRTDLMAIMDLMRRYGSKHALGQQLGAYLANYQRMQEDGTLQIEDTAIDGSCHNAIPKASLSSVTPQSTATPKSTPGGAASTIGSDGLDWSLASGVASGAGTSPAIPSLGSSGQTPESVGAASTSSSGNGQGVNIGVPSANLSCLDAASLIDAQGQGATLFDPTLLDFLDPATTQAASSFSTGIDGKNDINDGAFLADLVNGDAQAWGAQYFGQS